MNYKIYSVHTIRLVSRRLMFAIITNMYEFAQVQWQVQNERNEIVFDIGALGV